MKIFGCVNVVLAAIGVSYIIMVAKSAKINSFEECREGGWLVRAMVVYDYVAPTENDIEQECILWTGEKFVKRYAPGPSDALRDFAEKIDKCQSFGSQATLLNFTAVDMDAQYDNFGIGTSTENGHIPTVEEKVGIFRDNDIWAGKINEYMVDFKTNRVVSMRSIADPNGTPSYAMTADEANRIGGEKRALYTFSELPQNPDMAEVIREATEESAKRCLRDILGVELFGKISAVEYEFTHSVGKEVSGNSDNDARYAGKDHVLRWENRRYVPPAGLVSEMFPFVQVVVTNTGNVLSYESNLSFFGDL
ncbi:MAG: hypothetical protein UX58_C0002G0003 [Candidatus Wolfebacteria bacterium GW2011_GWB2_46_69]|nr:MAG: hypothetical protein UX70_C0001G0788 [Candidatus Wolfebacteria bacterium GW2011_GWB1_47_1]KKU42289.1 MAG: hypothetical protein UX58_C0002G0003 [Candidatus Wolfebacteria bacterium GW2011_GWB2_46_69]KKU58950.1 MAG: hypothetical protein UX83_C0010G0072 [Candidatus Wolfebacteria bacterium GW2011_GWE2_47_12]KKU66086.1 MAG: hypothetical protein UX90_C0001G0145 [Candidatus Wolfebacteria bacterium GW2011_GWD2_47_17]